MVIILGILVLGLVWWFVGRSSTQRRRPAGHKSAKPAARSDANARRAVPVVPGQPVADAVIEMVGVSKSYGRGERRRFALDGLDLTVARGEVFGLLGQNGAGKTTAMRCMLGLARPSAGTCRVLGADSGRDLHRVIDRVGALIETPGLTPSLSGRRNLLLLARLGRMDRGEVSRALEAAGLAEQADDAVATYSLGMRQRLGIAAALLRDPEVLILDEPANGLDPAGIAEVRHLLVGLARAGRTVIISSHQLMEVERILRPARRDRSGPLHSRRSHRRRARHGGRRRAHRPRGRPGRRSNGSRGGRNRLVGHARRSSRDLRPRRRCAYHRDPCRQGPLRLRDAARQTYAGGRLPRAHLLGRRGAR